MKAVIQRVKKATVSIAGEIVSAIDEGLLILLGIVPTDNNNDIEWLVRKCSRMRIFNDSEGIMNKSVIDINGEVLVVSQFTLAADISKGNRPSYIGAANHEIAIPLYENFCAEFSKAIGKPIKQGVFGADMQVDLINDGPVTIIADSHNK